MEEKVLDKHIEHIVDGVLTRKVKEVILEENHAKAPQTKALTEDGVDEETWKLAELSNTPVSPKMERNDDPNTQSQSEIDAQVAANMKLRTSAKQFRTSHGEDQFKNNAAKLQEKLETRPEPDKLRELNILKERNDTLRKAILRDQLGGKLASSWEKDSLLDGKHAHNAPDSPSSNSPDRKAKKEDIINSLVGKLLRRPSLNSLRRRHILVDGDPTFHARKMALKHLLLERTLNDQLSRKYEQSLKVEDEANNPEAIPTYDTTMALNALEGASMEKRSRFIKEIEDKGLFVCHKCCSTEFWGLFPNSFASRKYPFAYFFEEAESKQLGIRAPFHFETARREHLCNICYGVCSCGNQFPDPSTTAGDPGCLNCGALPGLRYEKIITASANAISRTASRDLEALNLNNNNGAPPAPTPPAPTTTTSNKERRNLKWNDKQDSGKLAPSDIKFVDRYLFFNHFTEERFLLIIRPDSALAANNNQAPFYLRKDDNEEAIEPLQWVTDQGYHWIYFKSPTSNAQQTFICTLPAPSSVNAETIVVQMPPNQAGIFLQDGMNVNYLYYADKNVCEYFLWNRATGEKFQVS